MMPATVEERLQALERRTATLDQQSKAFTMIFGAAFAAMSDDPDVIRKAIASLETSRRAAEQQDARVVVAQLDQVAVLLDALLHRKN
jgi:hypothetical protein